MNFILFGTGSAAMLITLVFAVLFHVASGHTKTDPSDGCLGLYICLAGAGISLSLIYFAAIF